jgi:hypothetical protein
MEDDYNSDFCEYESADEGNQEAFELLLSKESFSPDQILKASAASFHVVKEIIEAQKA